MQHYSQQKRFLFAVDCIIFGYDGQELKLLVIKRSFEPFKGKWSLVGGFINDNESAESAAGRVLNDLTGLDGLYMEQLHCFTDPNRDSVERTISIAYFALIDIQKYNQQIDEDYHPAWFSINQLPELIFDHTAIVEMAKEKLRYKAALHPLLFELLPDKFTMPQLQSLYEAVYNMEFDKGNFNRKLLSTKLLDKLEDKDKLNSKKGAFYYTVNLKKYSAGFKTFLNFVPSQYINK
ncbi:NUDIX domain-containing protein [Flavobacterium sp. LB2P84]|jgi:8-oxo-dGTP diphosphatase|uniref:NUDIX domain-containing protein n=1 Tax=Flavobacterium yafengii TaxID=3041253 RepID=A0AAW6TQB0_9FLAO|nr:NUDIX domain-containing protein [Flavobacterium yafengii]MDI5949868.1 NUDIX domain-containing protein [Flavobacterium yafengii]MDI6033841.1 NUDIX domain-containing protein [Flavobacterium yafengii]